MSGADKRGQLSSGLLGAKGAGTGPAAHGTGALKLASESEAEQPIESPDTPPAEPNPDILYTKGDASASTFRPSYWTFERKPSEAGSGATVTPISAAVAGRIAAETPAERAAPPAKPLWYRRTANIAVLSFSASALLASAAFFMLSFQHQAPSLPVAAAPTPPVSAPAGPQLSPPASPVQAIVGVVVPLPGGTPAPPAASEPSTTVTAAPTPSAVSEPSIPPVPSAPPVAAVAPAPSAPVARPPVPAPAPVVTAPASGAGTAAATPAPSAAPVQPSAPPAPATPVAAANPAPAPAPTSTEAPAIPATAAPAPETVPSEVAAAPTQEAAKDTLPLIARGDEMRFVGDFTAARLFYERAAEQGSAAAARAVGETYDPFVLEESHALGVRADARTAANWYRKAIEGGDTQAALRLQRLMTKPAN